MLTLTLRRHAHRLHRWLGLLIGLQVLIWLAGGLVMSALPIERVRGEHRIAEQAVTAVAPDAVLPLAEAAAGAGVQALRTARLARRVGTPVWHLEAADGRTAVVDALTGRILPPLNAKEARAAAEADYAGPGSVSAVERLTEPPTEYGRPGPVWRVTFADLDATALYVDETTGAVRARRSRTWRSFDLAWRLHVMDYDDGADFNHPLLIGAAGVAVVFALSGLVLALLWIWRTGQGRLRARAARARQALPRENTAL